MEKINEKYYLDSDAHNLILLERKIHGKDSDKKGEAYFITVGYFSTMEDLYKRMIEKEIKDDLGLIRNMEAIVKLIKELEKSKSNSIEKKSKIKEG